MSDAASDQAATVTDQDAPTTAGDAMIACTRTLRGPVVTALERSQTRVAEIWESEEALTRFFDGKIRPALQRAGIDGQPHVFEIFNTM